MYAWHSPLLTIPPVPHPLTSTARGSSPVFTHAHTHTPMKIIPIQNIVVDSNGPQSDILALCFMLGFGHRSSDRLVITCTRDRLTYIPAYPPPASRFPPASLNSFFITFFFAGSFLNYFLVIQVLYKMDH